MCSSTSSHHEQVFVVKGSGEQMFAIVPSAGYGHRDKRVFAVSPTERRRPAGAK